MFSGSINYSFDKNNPLKGITALPVSSSALTQRTAAAAGTAISQATSALDAARPPVPLDHCPLSDALIREHSLLETGAALPDFIESMHTTDPAEAILRFAANFLGGGLITGGEGVDNPEEGLDGMWPLPNYKMWQYLLNDLAPALASDCSERKILDNLRQGLTQLSDYSQKIDKLSESLKDKLDLQQPALQQLALEYAKKIQALRPSASQMIHGGWSNVAGGTGHALIYEFTRRQDSLFDVCVYTSTGHQLTDTVYAGDKERLKPVIRYEAVPEAVLLFNEDGVVRPGFVQALMEIHVLKQWNKNRVVDAQDVLEVFDVLEPYRKSVSLEEFGAITGQRAGTCVPSSTKQWIRRHTRHLGLHKQLMFHLKLRMLTGVYRSLKDKLPLDTPQGELSRRLLQQVSRKLLRRVAKLSEGVHGLGELVDADLALKAQATAYDLLQEVARHEKAIAEKKSKITESSLSGCDVERQRKKRGEAVLNGNQPSEYRAAEPSSLPSTVNTPLVPANVVNEIQNVIRATQYNTYTNQKEVNLFEIHRMVDRLPLPKMPEKAVVVAPGQFWIDGIKDTFWDQLDVPAMLKVQEQLELLAKNYLAALQLQPPENPTRQHATLFALHALCHYLALKIDAEKIKKLPSSRPEARLESYKIPFLGKLADEMTGLTYFDRNEHLRCRDAVAYFNAFNAQAKNDPLFVSEKDTKVVQHSVHEAPTNGVYWQAILEADNTLRTAADQLSTALLPDLTVEQIQRDYQQEADAHNKYQKELSDYNACLNYRTSLDSWRIHRIGPEPQWPPGLVPRPRYDQPLPVKEPQEKVNLPQTTKRTLILESNVGYWNNALQDRKLFLSQSGYQHVTLLRQMTHVSRTLMYAQSHMPWTRMELNTMTPQRASPYSYEACVYKRVVNLQNMEDETRYKALDVQHRRPNNDHICLLVQYPYANRKMLSWEQSIAEGKTLQNKNLDPLDVALLRTLSEWKLTPHQMILEFSQELERLKDPSMQTLFNLFFFRSVVDESDTAQLGTGQLICDDDALFESSRKFIQVGLNHFLRQERPVEGGRFFFELACYLSKYLADAGNQDKAKRISPIAELNRWLAKDGLKDKERATLHLYRVLAYTAFPFDSLKEEELEAIYQSWISYQYCAEEGEYKSPMVQRLVNTAMLDLTAKVVNKFGKDQEQVSRLCTSVIRYLKLDNCEGDMIWKVDPLGVPMYRVERGAGNFWQINLATGKVYCLTGQLGGIDTDYPWEQQEDFKRAFFGQKGFTYRSIGGGNIVFSHPKLGQFRLIRVEKRQLSGGWYSQTINYAIQRQFPGSEQWYEYQDNSTMNGLPAALVSDHTLWVPVGRKVQTAGKTIKAYIATLKNHKRRYALMEDGQILQVDAPTGQANANSLRVDFLTTSFDQPKDLCVRRFDEGKNILSFRETTRDACERLQFCRYTSQEGNPLVFRRDGNRLVWNDNTGYMLPGEMSTHHLGTIKNYLSLASVDGKGPEKLLVPFQPIESANVPVARADIAIQNITPLIKPKKEPTEQWGAFQYFVYNVENGRVKPTTQEGQLYLAYIYQSQKRYHEAIDLIRKIKSTETVSPMGMLILQMIQDLPLGEDNPEAAMAAAHALCLTMKQMDRAAKETVKHYFSDNDTGLKKLSNAIFSFQKYLQSIDNVPLASRLTSEEEMLLLERLKTEGTEKKLPMATLMKIEEQLILKALDRFARRLKYLQKNKKDPQNQSVIPGGRVYPKSDSGRYWGPFTQTDVLGRTIAAFPVKPTQPDEPNPRSYRYRTRAEAKQAGYSFIETHEDAMDSYRAKMNIYWAQVHSYETELQQKTAWLTQGATSTRMTCPQTDKIFKDNGNMLQEVLRIAKGNSSLTGERKEMLFRLLQWRLHSDGQDLHHLELMIAILFKPECFSALTVSDLQTSETKMHFIKQLYSGYVSSNPPSYRLSQIHALLSRTGGGSFGARPAAPAAGAYPILQGTAFDDKEKDVAAIAADKTPVALDAKPDDTVWKRLASWRNENCTFIEQIKSDKDDFTLQFDESLLSNHEKKYQESLKRDLILLQRDYNAGKQQNERNKQLMITPDNSFALKKDATALLSEIRKKREDKEKELREKANVKSDNPLERQAEMARIGGRASEELSFLDCLGALLSGDGREYIKRNRHLGEGKRIDELAQLTLAIEDLKSNEAQLSRILDLSEKIGKISDLNDPTRLYLCQRLDGELSARCHLEGFSPDVQAVLRVFAGQTGMIPHKKQADLLIKMLEMDKNDPERYRDIVIQLIMGGGKTSVLATIILYLASQRRGNLALFLVPSSQFSTVCENFGQAFHLAFNKDILSLDVDREDLTVYKLKQLNDMLQRAKKEGLPIVTKSTSLQCLELELLTQARYLKKCVDDLHDLTDKVKGIQNRIRILELQKGELLTAGRKGEAMRVKAKKRLAKSQLKMQQEREASTRKQLEGIKTKIGLLHKVVEQFPANADALLDEVDLLLDCLQEVNFPAGDTIPVSAIGNALLHKVYQTLISKDVKVRTENGEMSVAEITKLEKNDQKDMMEDPTNPYEELVVPAVAKELVDKFKLFKDNLPSEYVDSFVRYVSGKMLPCVQLFADGKSFYEEALQKENRDWQKTYKSLKEVQNDIAFLRYLKQQYETKDKKKQEVANTIALARHFLVTLTPATLKKSGQRDYGLKPDGAPGAICPYLGINRAATTEFGYHWEKACYYYQYAAAFGVEENQIRDIAKTAKTLAEQYQQKNGEALEDTCEYQDFYKWFGVKLDKLDEPGALKTAQAHIGKDIQLRLDMQHEMVSRHVNFRTERLTSNGMALIDMLRSRRTMSGTPWNVEGYARSLTKRYFPDEGTMGKILHTIAQRMSTGKIHTVDFNTIEEFLGPIFRDHKSPNKIRGIIEGGGIFKVFKDNADVAKQIMDFLAKKQEEHKIDDSIQGVLYFDKDPGQKTPDTLYVWRKGAVKPERIGGSSVESLKAKGLDPSKYFVYYDEPHTTGTDILQDPNAINLVTVNGNTPLRTLGQGIMRLRQFLISQNVEFVVTSAAKENMYNSGKTKESVVLATEKVESVRKTEGMVRYFRQQIDNIYRRQAVKEIFEAAKNVADHEAFARVVDRSAPFAVTSMAADFNSEGKEAKLAQVVGKHKKSVVSELVDQPYLLHGELQQKVATKEMLSAYLKKKQDAFEHRIDTPSTVAAAKAEAEEMQRHIGEAESLPSEWEATPSAIGVEVNVEQQVQVEQQVEVEMEVEQEVEIELQRYEGISATQLRRDEGMTKIALLQMIQALRSAKPAAPNLISLKTQLSSFDYGLFEERAHYEEIFTNPIYGTRAYFYTCPELLPIFHPLQRPPKQILAVKAGGTMQWLLVSEHEAEDVRRHLRELYKEGSKDAEGVWLIQPDGQTFLNTEANDEFPIGDDAIDAGLIEINALCGNIGYLDQNASGFELFLAKNAELAVRFLNLRTLRNKTQNRLLRSCPTVLSFSHEIKGSPSQHMFSSRVEREKSRQGKIDNISAAEVKLLAPRKIKELNVKLVRHLGIDWEKRRTDEATKQALAELRSKIPASAWPAAPAAQEEVLKKLAREHTKSQMEALRLFQGPGITADQVKFLPASKVELLELPEQIYRSETKEYLLSPEQVGGLKEHQKHLLPYVNPECYGAFTAKWQVESVPPEYINKINPELYMHLSKDQVHGIKEENKKFLELLSIPEKFSWVHGNLLDAIPADYLSMVTEEQIREITVAEVIRKLDDIASKHRGTASLDSGVWLNQISPKMVKHLDFNKQLKRLKRPELIHEVPKDHVPQLDSDQVGKIGENQVEHLVAKQIPYCPNKLVKWLKEGQLPHITHSQVPYLIGSGQVQTITDLGKFACLKAEPSSIEGYANQMCWISDAQLKLVSKGQVKGLSNDQLLKLKGQVAVDAWKGLSEGLTKEQVEKFDSVELVALLTEDQIKTMLSKDQVTYLVEVWQIQACPNTLVQYLKDDQIEHISDEQVPYLRENNQVRAIKTKEKFKLLSAEEDTAKGLVSQMQWIKEEQFAFVCPEQVKGLKGSQLLTLSILREDEWNTSLRDHMTKAQISEFASQDLIDLLSAKQIKDHLEQVQVQYLKKDWQIQACPDKLVPHLSKDQVPYVSVAQVPLLRGKDQVQAINSEELFKALTTETDDAKGHVNQMPWISNAQLKWVQQNQLPVLTKEQLLAMSTDHLQAWNNLRTRMTPQQIETFDSKLYVKLLNEDQINKHLGETQVPFLTKGWQIQACPDELVCKLDGVQIGKILPRQVPFLEGPAQVVNVWHTEPLVQQFQKRHLEFLATGQAKLLSPDQIAQMDKLKEVQKLPEELMVHLSEKGVQACDDTLVERLQANETLHDQIPFVKPEQLHLITNKKAVAKVEDSQVDAFSDKYNGIDPKHPLWKRITPKAVNAVQVDKIKSIPSKKLQYLTDKAKIRKVSFWKVKHLTRQQLRSRSRGQALGYILGVVTLGVLGSVAAALAHMTLVPLGIWLVSRPKGRRAMKRLHASSSRMARLFKVYC